MTPTGFEQVAKTREKRHFSDDPKHNPKQLLRDDPLLADLIELWPTLDKTIKERILSLADTKVSARPPSMKGLRQ